MEDVAVMPPSIDTKDTIADDAESDTISLDLHVSDTEEPPEDLQTSLPKGDVPVELEDDILDKFADELGTKVPNTRINGIIKAISTQAFVNGVSSPEECVQQKKNENGVEGPVQADEKEESVGKDVCNSEREMAEEKNIPIKDENITIDEENALLNESISIKDENVSINVEEAKEETKKEDEEEDLLQVMETVEDGEEEKDETSCSSSEKEEHAKEDEETKDGGGSNNEETTSELGTPSDDFGGEAANDDGGGCPEDDNEEDVDDPPQASEHRAADGRKPAEEDRPRSPKEMDVDINDMDMDIEENDIGGVIVAEKEKTVGGAKATKEAESRGEENEKTTETDETVAREETKESTEKSDDGTPVVNGEVGENDVPLADEGVSSSADKTKDAPAKKPLKRQWSTDDPVEKPDNKKMKLDATAPVVKNEKTRIETLKTLKDYMREKQLKIMTRAELEELCLQKMCEWIMDKSELAELRQKVKTLEQMLDAWRKEAVTVAKQTRDLKIVHDRVLNDLKAMKEHTGKPLVPVKITRSVGLQAVLESAVARRTSIPNGLVPLSNNSRTSTNGGAPNAVKQNSVRNVANTPSPATAKTPARQQQSVQQTPKQQQRIPVKTSQPTALKDTRTTAAKPTPPPQTTTAPRKSTEPPKAVIDLTDEDDKAQPQPQPQSQSIAAIPSITLTPTSRAGSRLNGQSPKTTTIVTSANSATKLMLIDSSMLTRPVMLKVANSNLVATSGALTVPNSQVSIVTAQPVLSKSVQKVRVPVTTLSPSRQSTQKFKHPAPLPPPPASQTHVSARKPIPPRPILNLTKSTCGTGIVLQWKMPYQLELYETVVSYQLYAYQETKTPPRTDNWGKIGDVKALELPMAVTLTQFAVGNRYFFAVRAVDSHKRLGPFSEPQTILL